MPGHAGVREEMQERRKTPTMSLLALCWHAAGRTPSMLLCHFDSAARPSDVSAGGSLGGVIGWEDFRAAWGLCGGETGGSGSTADGDR